MGLTKEAALSFGRAHCPFPPRRQFERDAPRRRFATRSYNESRSDLEFRCDLIQLKRALYASPEHSEDLEPDDHYVIEGIVPERVLLVGLAEKSTRDTEAYSLEESLEELASLASTAGLKVVTSLYQYVEAPSPATYVGAGKLKEIQETVEREGISTVVFDAELSPVQSMNMEKALGEGIRICDRTALTLDIFSQRAFSKEGKMQVELAQCKYQSPRLTRLWTHLERQVGGAGSDRAVKGMGEKQIEIDKRLLRKRMTAIAKDLEEVKLQRRLKRNRRAERDMPVIALIGYTNAGKSSLLNALTQSTVLVEDRLFATLDPTTRRLKLPGGKTVLMSDTVGFIQRLPPQLVAAFGATLEELLDATLLMHVVDATSPQREKQQSAVMTVLESIGAQNIPVLTAWSKTDRLPPGDRSALEEAVGKLEDTYCISSATGLGLECLMSAVEDAIEASMVPANVLVPYDQGDLVRSIHDHGVVKECRYDKEGTLIEASVPIYLAARLKRYLVEGGNG